jgi:hypothetical protein
LPPELAAFFHHGAAAALRGAEIGAEIVLGNQGGWGPQQTPRINATRYTNGTFDE